jgi:hypothetical protein
LRRDDPHAEAEVGVLDAVDVRRQRLRRRLEEGFLDGGADLARIEYAEPEDVDVREWLPPRERRVGIVAARRSGGGRCFVREVASAARIHPGSTAIAHVAVGSHVVGSGRVTSYTVRPASARGTPFSSRVRYPATAAGSKRPSSRIARRVTASSGR